MMVVWYDMIRAGLTIWWALCTPQRRGPTGKLDAEEGERGGRGVPLPSQLWVMENVV